MLNVPDFNSDIMSHDMECLGLVMYLVSHLLHLRPCLHLSAHVLRQNIIDKKKYISTCIYIKFTYLQVTYKKYNNRYIFLCSVVPTFIYFLRCYIKQPKILLNVTRLQLRLHPNAQPRSKFFSLLTLNKLKIHRPR